MARSLAPSRTARTALSTRRSSFLLPSSPRKPSVVVKTTCAAAAGCEGGVNGVKRRNKKHRAHAGNTVCLNDGQDLRAGGKELGSESVSCKPRRLFREKLYWNPMRPIAERCD